MFQRATLSTSSPLKTTVLIDTIDGGEPNDAPLGLNGQTAFGGFDVDPVDKLKR